MAVKGIFSCSAAAFVYGFKMYPILHHRFFSQKNDKNDQVSEKLLAVRHVRSSFVLLRNYGFKLKIHDIVGCIIDSECIGSIS